MKNSPAGTKIMKTISLLLKNDTEMSKIEKGKWVILPALRLLFVLFLIILISLSKNAAFVIVVFAGLVVRLAMLKPETIKMVVMRLVPASLLTAIIMLPAVFLGNPRSLIVVTGKVICSVLTLSELNASVAWKDLTHALQDLHLPQIFILTIDMTVHFLVILGRVSNAIVEAVELRTCGKKNPNWKKAPTGGILGTTYLISERMSRESSEAMVVRGFSGEYKTLKKHKFNWMDLLYLFAFVLVLLIYIYLERAM